jgi:hypothetical protein
LSRRIFLSSISYRRGSVLIPRITSLCRRCEMGLLLWQPYIHIYMCVCIWAYVCMCIYAYMCMSACVYMCMSVYVYEYMSICVWVYEYMYACIHIMIVYISNSLTHCSLSYIYMHTFLLCRSPVCWSA